MPVACYCLHVATTTYIYFAIIYQLLLILDFPCSHTTVLVCVADTRQSRVAAQHTGKKVNVTTIAFTYVLFGNACQIAFDR